MAKEYYEIYAMRFTDTVPKSIPTLTSDDIGCDFNANITGMLKSIQNTEMDSLHSTRMYVFEVSGLSTV